MATLPAYLNALEGGPLLVRGSRGVREERRGGGDSEHHTRHKPLCKHYENHPTVIYEPARPAFGHCSLRACMDSLIHRWHAQLHSCVDRLPVPSFFGCAGRGVHIVTVNPYLAKRDAEWWVGGWVGGCQGRCWACACSGFMVGGWHQCRWPASIRLAGSGTLNSLQRPHLSCTAQLPFLSPPQHAATAVAPTAFAPTAVAATAFAPTAFAPTAVAAGLARSSPFWVSAWAWWAPTACSTSPRPPWLPT